MGISIHSVGHKDCEDTKGTTVNKINQFSINSNSQITCSRSQLNSISGWGNKVYVLAIKGHTRILVCI